MEATGLMEVPPPIRSLISVSRVSSNVINNGRPVGFAAILCNKGSLSGPANPEVAFIAKLSIMCL